MPQLLNPNQATYVAVPNPSQASAAPPAAAAAPAPAAPAAPPAPKNPFKTLPGPPLLIIPHTEVREPVQQEREGRPEQFARKLPTIWDGGTYERYKNHDVYGPTGADQGVPPPGLLTHEQASDIWNQLRANPAAPVPLDMQLVEGYTHENPYPGYGRGLYSAPRSHLQTVHGLYHLAFTTPGGGLSNHYFPLQDLKQHGQLGDPYRVWSAAILTGNKHIIPPLVQLLRDRGHPLGAHSWLSELYRRMPERSWEDVKHYASGLAEQTAPHSQDAAGHRQILERIKATPDDQGPYLALADHMREHGLDHYGQLLHSELAHVNPSLQGKIMRRPPTRKQLEREGDPEQFGKPLGIPGEAIFSPQEQKKLKSWSPDVTERYHTHVSRSLEGEHGLMPTTGEIKILDHVGRSVHGQYGHTGEPLTHLLGNDAFKMWNNLNTSYSAQCPWEQHSTAALMTIVNWMDPKLGNRSTDPARIYEIVKHTVNMTHGETGQGLFPMCRTKVKIKKATAIIHAIATGTYQGEFDPWMIHQKGIGKTVNFGQAFIGPNGVPVDTWMSRLTVPQASDIAHQMKTAMIKKAAKKYEEDELSLPEYQAIITQAKGISVASIVRQLNDGGANLGGPRSYDSPLQFDSELAKAIANSGQDHLVGGLLKAQQMAMDDPTKFMAMKALIGQVAHENGLEPREVQEAAWTVAIAIASAKHLGLPSQEVWHAMHHDAIRQGWDVVGTFFTPELIDSYAKLSIPRSAAEAIQRQANASNPANSFTGSVWTGADARRGSHLGEFFDVAARIPGDTTGKAITAKLIKILRQQHRQHDLPLEPRPWKAQRPGRSVKNTASADDFHSLDLALAYDLADNAKWLITADALEEQGHAALAAVYRYIAEHAPAATDGWGQVTGRGCAYFGSEHCDHLRPPGFIELANQTHLYDHFANDERVPHPSGKTLVLTRHRLVDRSKATVPNTPHTTISLYCKHLRQAAHVPLPNDLAEQLQAEVRPPAEHFRRTAPVRHAASPEDTHSLIRSVADAPADNARWLVAADALRENGHDSLADLFAHITTTHARVESAGHYAEPANQYRYSALRHYPKEWERAVDATAQPAIYGSIHGVPLKLQQTLLLDQNRQPFHSQWQATVSHSGNRFLDIANDICLPEGHGLRLLHDLEPFSDTDQRAKEEHLGQAPAHLQRPVQLGHTPQDFAQLHAGIAANPADDARWLVAADALRENGHDALADLYTHIAQRVPYHEWDAMYNDGEPNWGARMLSDSESPAHRPAAWQQMYHAKDNGQDLPDFEYGVSQKLTHPSGAKLTLLPRSLRGVPGSEHYDVDVELPHPTVHRSYAHTIAAYAVPISHDLGGRLLAERPVKMDRRQGPVRCAEVQDPAFHEPWRNAISQKWEDSAPHLVYADALEEQDDPRHKIIRDQIRQPQGINDGEWLPGSEITQSPFGEQRKNDSLPPAAHYADGSQIVLRHIYGERSYSTHVGVQWIHPIDHKWRWTHKYEAQIPHQQIHAYLADFDPEVRSTLYEALEADGIRRPEHMDRRQAPQGGLLFRGINYPGGEFLPKDPPQLPPPVAPKSRPRTGLRQRLKDHFAGRQKPQAPAGP